MEIEQDCNFTRVGGEEISGLEFKARMQLFAGAGVGVCFSLSTGRIATWINGLSEAERCSVKSIAHSKTFIQQAAAVSLFTESRTESNSKFVYRLARTCFHLHQYQKQSYSWHACILEVELRTVLKYKHGQFSYQKYPSDRTDSAYSQARTDRTAATSPPEEIPIVTSAAALLAVVDNGEAVD